jgi:hypothetical protein
MATPGHEHAVTAARIYVNVAHRWATPQLVDLGFVVEEGAGGADAGAGEPDPRELNRSLPGAEEHGE